LRDPADERAESLFLRVAPEGRARTTIADPPWARIECQHYASPKNAVNPTARCQLRRQTHVSNKHQILSNKLLAACTNCPLPSLSSMVAITHLGQRSGEGKVAMPGSDNLARTATDTLEGRARQCAPGCIRSQRGDLPMICHEPPDDARLGVRLNGGGRLSINC
jgi:hypothetical protein